MLKKQSIVIALAGLLALAQSSWVSGQEQESKLLAVMASPTATLNDKNNACRELGIVGANKTVVALAGLLADETLAQMARNALETIPDPAVDETFRAATGKVQGKLLVGVISSIGVRKDAKAVEILAKLVNDADSQVGSAAAMALGEIGDAAAIKTLETAMASAPAGAKLKVYDGYLRAADSLLKQGKGDQAVAMYDRVRGSDALRFVRLGATRGAILARGAAGAALLVEQIKSDDAAMFAAALSITQVMPGASITQAVAAELPKLSADKQILVVQALAVRQDTAALPAVVELAKNGAATVKPVAIRALPQFKDTSVAGLLFEMCLAGEAQTALVAQVALTSLAGKEVDAFLQERMGSQDLNARRLSMQMLAERRVMAIMPTLLKGAEDADEQIRASAIKALGELAGLDQIDGLGGILIRAKGQAESTAAESALAATCVRVASEQASADKLVAMLPQAPVPAKCAILRVLRSVGGAKALAAELAAVKDADAQVQDTAVRVICEWTSLDAATDILAIAKAPAKPNHKILALRGYVRLSREKSLSDLKRIDMCKEALTLADRDEEKRMVVGAMGGITTAPALTAVLALLDTPAVKDSAATAALTISEKLVARNPKAVADAMNKLLGVYKDGLLADRAKEMLARTKK